MFADPDGPGGQETTERRFLHSCRMTAQARMNGRRGGRPAFVTLPDLLRASPAARRTPAGPGMPDVRVLASRTLLHDWQAALDGPESALSNGIPSPQLRVVLSALCDDLRANEQHLFLPLRPRDVAACADDVTQAVQEALARTPFASALIPCQPRITWEGTLVTRLQPLQTLVVIALER